MQACFDQRSRRTSVASVRKIFGRPTRPSKAEECSARWSWNGSNRDSIRLIVVGAAARTDSSNNREASGMLAGRFHRPVSFKIFAMRQDQTFDLPPLHGLANCGMSLQVVAVARCLEFFLPPR